MGLQKRSHEKYCRRRYPTLIHYLTNENLDAGADDAMRYLSIATLHLLKWFSQKVREITWGYDGGVKENSTEYSAVWYHMKEKDGVENWYSLYSNYGYDVEQIGTVEATIRLADELTQPDTYYYADLLISLAFAMRFWVYAIGIGAAILAIAAFVFSLCAHLVRKMVWQQRSRDGVRRSPLTC